MQPSKVKTVFPVLFYTYPMLHSNASRTMSLSHFPVCLSQGFYILVAKMVDAHISTVTHSCLSLLIALFQGSQLLRRQVAGQDDPLVKALREAGAVILGKVCSQALKPGEAHL